MCGRERGNERGGKRRKEGVFIFFVLFHDIKKISFFFFFFGEDV